MATVPVFRVTTYSIPTASFAGKTYLLNLRHELAPDYFTIVEWAVDNAGNIPTADVAVQVVGDPYGTGDLTVTTGNYLQLQRGSSTVCSVAVVVTVVECLRDQDGAGFRLRDVQVTAIAAAGLAGVQTVTDTSAAWVDVNKVVPFGGFRGGGLSVSSAATTELYIFSAGVRVTPTGTTTLSFRRYDPTGTQAIAASITTYVVEWGGEWTCDRVTVTGTNAGTTLANAADYSAQPLTQPATRACSWVWACGYTDGVGAGDCCLAQVATLGDGAAQNASESTVAVGCAGTGAITIRSVDVYVLQHAQLATDWVFKTAAAGVGAQSLTVDTALGTELYLNTDYPLYVTATEGRLALLHASAPSTATNELGQSLVTARHTAATVVTCAFADPNPTLNWVGWLQSLDLTRLTIEQGGEPALRSTTYRISGSTFNATTYDLILQYPLSSNYFVMIVGSTPAVQSPTPADCYAWVSRDPLGTGDLTASAGASTIRLERGTSANPWVGTVTVVECLSGEQHEGFRLVDVRAVALPAFTDVGVQVVNASTTTSWSALDRVVLFAGHRGGGIQPTGPLTATEIQGLGAAVIPTGTNGLQVMRYTASNVACRAATVWVYVVEFGDQWQVQQLLVQATAGGPDVNATGEYANFFLPTTVVSANTWVWGSFSAELDSTDSCWLSPALHLGNGVTQATTENRVAVGLWQQNAYLGALYVMSHSELRVQWLNQATTASTGLNLTVNSPVRSEGYGAASGQVCGSRFALAYTAMSTATTPADQPATMIQVAYSAPTTIRMRRDRSEGTWSGWIQSVDAGALFASVGGVEVWSTDALALTPQQYLVLQDALWDGAASLLRVTSEGGRVAGTIEPASTNLGSVVGQVEGTPTADTGLVFLLRGGAVGGSGGFVWRTDAEDGDDDWKAMNALTTFWRQDGVSASVRFSGHDVVYSTVYQRLIVAVILGVTSIRVYYKDVNNIQGDGWSFVSIITTDCADSTTSPLCGMGVCEEPDGSLLLCYQQQDQVTLYYNITTYSSTDGGLTWTRLGSRILNKVPDAALLPFCQGQHQMDSSGDWVRISFLTSESLGLGAITVPCRTIVSPDRGASWSGTSADLAVYSWRSPTGYPGAFPVAMVGLGDASGTFMMAYLPSLSSTTIAIAMGSRGDDWERNTDLDWDISGYATAPAVKALCFVRSPDRVWLFAWVEGSDASELVVQVFSPADPANADSWTEMGQITGLGGVLRYGPHQLRGVFAGHRLILSAGLHDPDVAAGADPVVAGHWMVQSGAYDPKPWDYTQEDSNYNDYFLGGSRLAYYQWQPCMGNVPAGAASSDALSPWTGVAVAGGTQVWANQTGITFTAAVAADAAYNLLTIGVPTAVDRWGYQQANRGTCFYVRVQVTGQRVTPSSAEDMGIRIQALRDAGVNGYDYTVRLGTTQLVLRDNQAVATKYTVTTTDFTQPCELRITEWRAQVWVAWRLISAGPLAAWTEVAPETMTNGALAAQSFRIGALAAVGAGTGSVMIWSDLVISYRSDVGQRADLARPGDLMGTRLNREAMLVSNGLRVRWGGSGASDADEFTAALEYMRGSQNLSLDSPRYYWESSDLDEQELVFYGDAVAQKARWQMNALLLVGTVDRTCTLQFSTVDSTAAWAAPAAEYELDATLWEDLTVMSVDGSTVQLVAATGATFAPRPGALVGCFLRFTLAGLATGFTFRIANDLGDDGTGRWLLVDGNPDLLTEGVAPGAKACIFGDRMVFIGEEWNRYAYFRIVFPDLSAVSSSRGTYPGTHRIGAMVPGFWRLLDPPMDWSVTDNEQPNTTAYRSKGGAGWEFEEGPGQRVFRGTMVGDVQEGRRSLRDLLRSHHGYSVRPLGLVTDSTHLDRDSVIYGRWSAGGQMEDAAWYRDAEGVWRTAGDFDLLVTEET